MKNAPFAAAALMVALAGCASQDWSTEPLPITVSAANYSQVSGEDLYFKVNAPIRAQPTAPAVTEPTGPLFYAFVPGQIYPSDVALPTVYRELAVPLAQRGYFNVVYQMEAGLKPNRVDYLLRINVGDRMWKIPTVRTDKVTWGDDGLSSSWQGAYGGTQTKWLVGPDANWDPRAGMSPLELMYIEGMQDLRYKTDLVEDQGSTRESALIMVEAYRYADVMLKRKNAPCVWATFIAVKLHPGQDLSAALRTMAHKAMPYFGQTTEGVQLFTVPPGEVLLGEPVEVPMRQDEPRPKQPPSP